MEAYGGGHYRYRRYLPGSHGHRQGRQADHGAATVYCVGPRDYAGDLKPRLHPRRLLDGVIEGVARRRQ